MRRSPARLARWARLGRLLPRRTRERIFEPAFYDELRCALGPARGRGSVWGSWGSAPFGVRVLAIFSGSLLGSLWRAVLAPRPRTVCVVIIVLSIVLLLLRGWLEQLYGAATPTY